MKVRIKSLGLPKAAYGQQANYGLSLNGSGNAGSMQSNEFAMKSGLKPKRTIGGVPREEANLEAEGGETVVGQISGDGIVDHMTIKGPRHSSGGVPMNLPDDSFIFSDTKSMKIKDPKILQMFGKSKGSYTPAELAKPYDISKYKAILMDPDTDRLSRNTAEIMIKNIVMKLGALALAQEAKKGFPQGIPEIAKPYMEANGISEEDLMPELKAQAEQMQAMQQQQAMQMQQAQGMQQPQMQQQGPPQGMPPMMPDGQPVAMPQQGMAPPQQPMMDPRQMMAMQQEQQMMPPQPQQGMPMAQEGIQSNPLNWGTQESIQQSIDQEEYERLLEDSIPSSKNRNYSETGVPFLCPEGHTWNPKFRRCVPDMETIYSDPDYKKTLDFWNEAEKESLNNMIKMWDEDKEYMEERNIERPEFLPEKLLLNTPNVYPKEGMSPKKRLEIQENFPMIWPDEKGYNRHDFRERLDNTKMKSGFYPCCKPKDYVNNNTQNCKPCDDTAAYGGTPMAAYGMQLGGYDMPFVMGTGGVPRYDHGGTHETVTLPDGRVVPSTSTEALTYENRGVTTSGGKEAAWEETITPGQEGDAVEAANTTRLASTPAEVDAWKNGLCERMKPGGDLHGSNPVDVAKEHFGKYWEANVEFLKDCHGEAEIFEDTTKVVAHHIAPVEDVTEGTCGCPDPEGGTNEDGTPKLINVQTKAVLGLAEDEECPPEYCEETTTITENPPNEIEPLPLIPATSFRRGVADPIKPGLDIIGAGERNYLDYRTAVQNDQGALEKQIAAIKTMPGVSVGQKQAMIAQVQAQSKAPSIVTDVYNKNVATANELAKSDMALAANQQQLQAGIDGQYNQDLANAENQYTQNVNAARQYKVENAKDNMRMQMMMRSIDNASENFDALGNFTGGTELQRQQYAACIAAGGSRAQCMAQILGTAPVESETPAPASVNAPPPEAPVAKYGRIVNPYIMASSVYPWSK